MLKKGKSYVKKDGRTFEKFCKLESISYWMGQIRGSRYKNISKSTTESTQIQYARCARRFDAWLIGREFTIIQTEQTSHETFRRITKKVTLKGLEHMLNLYRQQYSEKSDFVKMTKTYLLDDDSNKGKKAESMTFEYPVIKSYFEKNETPLDFKFDPKARYLSSSDMDVPSMSLEDLMKLLTVGRPTLTEKAVFLCKFHRGLDSSTLCDRFNFEAWDQLRKYFGTEHHNSWDTQKCPAPVKLTRIKTGFLHTGFLDRDSIASLQEYLDYRESKMGNTMSAKQPMFLTKQNKPITSAWISDHFEKLCKNAGLHKPIPGYLINKYEITPHG